VAAGRPNPRAILFVALALGLVGIGLAAVMAGRWPIAVAAFVLGVWMGDLALRELGLRRW
jgi:uncharacterized membrane protein YjjP (DUF1212 family)